MKNVYVNIDINTVNCPFLDDLIKKDTFFKEDLYPFVDIYRGTQVTDIVFNVNAQSSVTDSVYWDSYKDLYERTEENGKAVDYKDYWKSYYVVNQVYKTDPFAVWIDRCNSNGQNSWLSFRMNDAHGFDNETYMIRSMFYYEAVKNGWVIGDEYDYYKGCYDYAVKEIRDKMLGYIREQTLRYNVYGIELDFSREIKCFKYLTADMDECTKIMNQFIRDVKAIALEAEKVHGHPVKILVRVGRDMKHTTFYGFDPVTWSNEKLIDIIVPTSRFASTDSGIPIDEWKEAVPNLKVVAGMETLVNVNSGGSSATKEIALGLCANYLSYDPDGLYFYNYYISPLMYGYPPQITKFTWQHTRSLATMHSCADYESIYQHPVRFVLIPQLDKNVGCPSRWLPIPAPLSDKETVIDLRTGKIPSGRLLSIVIGIKNDSKSFEVALNGNLCKDWHKINIEHIPGMNNQRSTYVTDDVTCYRCVVDESMLCDPVQKISITSTDSNEILDWVELDVV